MAVGRATKGKEILDMCWIFRNKQDDNRVIVQNKDRLVVRGFRQIEFLDYTEVYAFVAHLEAICIFLAYASYMGFLQFIKWMSIQLSCTES